MKNLWFFTAVVFPILFEVSHQCSSSSYDENEVTLPPTIATTTTATTTIATTTIATTTKPINSKYFLSILD